MIERRRRADDDVRRRTRRDGDGGEIYRFDDLEQITAIERTNERTTTDRRMDDSKQRTHQSPSEGAGCATIDSHARRGVVADATTEDVVRVVADVVVVVTAVVVVVFALIVVDVIAMGAVWPNGDYRSIGRGDQQKIIDRSIS